MSSGGAPAQGRDQAEEPGEGSPDNPLYSTDRRAQDVLLTRFDAAALVPVLEMGTESREVGMVGAAVLGAGALLLATRLWAVSRGAAIMVVPLAGLAAYQAFGLL